MAMRTAISCLRVLVPALLLGGALGVASLGSLGPVSHAETTGATTAAAETGPAGPIDFRTAFKDSIIEMPDQGSLSAHGTIYVPAYSRVYGAAAGSHKLLQLSTTLRIDNTSSTKPLVIERIEFYETSGKLVQSYLSEPMALRPFGTIEIVIPAEDDRGGVASNFIVTWAGTGPISEPLVEAVMIGSENNTSYSFVSPGRPLRNVGRSPWPQFRFRF
jgi:hypothetical protein